MKANTSLKIYCDGGARGNPGPAAAAFVVEKDEKVIYKGSKFLGAKNTNNFAEYMAVILALGWLFRNESLEWSDGVTIILDSELVSKQLSGLYKIKNEKLKKLYLTAKDLEKKTKKIVLYKNVPRAKNKLADFLVNQTLDNNL